MSKKGGKDGGGSMDKEKELGKLYKELGALRCSPESHYTESKSGERGEHARAIFLPLLCYFLVCVRAQDVHWCLFLAPAVLMFGPNSLGN